MRVFLVIGVLGPAIENEIVECNVPGGVLHANWTGIAHPATIGRHTEKSHVVQIDVGLLQDCAHAGFRGTVLDKKKNTFDARKVADNLREGPGNRRKFSRPVC